MSDKKPIIITPEELEAKRNSGVRFFYLNEESLKFCFLRDEGLLAEYYPQDAALLQKGLEDLENKRAKNKKDYESSDNDLTQQITDIKQKLAVMCPEKHRKATASTKPDPNSKNLLTVDYSIKPTFLNYTLDTHPNRNDTISIDMSKVEHVLTLKPSESKVQGHENLKRLKALALKENKILLDCRVLEELLKNPHLIPEDWKKVRTYFWGTIFRGGGNLYVAYLYWSGGQWWDYCWLDGDWDSDEPAAVASV